MYFGFFSSSFFKYITTPFESESIGNLDEILWYSLVIINLLMVSSLHLYVLGMSLSAGIYSWPLIFIVFNLIATPFVYSYSLGFNFLDFIRGCGSVFVAVYEYVLDVSNIISFILRIWLQLIRLVIILITAYTFYQFWNEIITFIDQVIGETILFSYVVYVYTVLLNLFHFLFELGHFGLVLFMQLTAFCVMTVWLFQFLYTSYIKPLLENK